MAHIVADHGLQGIATPDGAKRCYVFEMDCGCEVRVDERAFLTGTRTNGVTLRDRLGRVAAAHDCNVVVHHAPERHRREIRERQREQQNRYNVYRDAIMRNWMADESRPTPIDWTGLDAPPGGAGIKQVPALAPEQAVRNAVERIFGVQVSGLIVDEVNPPAQPTVGFKAPEPKKPERPKDRFELIELD